MEKPWFGLSGQRLTADHAAQAAHSGEWGRGGRAEGEGRPPLLLPSNIHQLLGD